MDFIETEVVICGSGSAGICAAIWLAQAGISFRFLETMDGPLEIGQADGVACRTVEIFESFGISEELLREAYHVNELTFWSMRDQELCRTGRAPDTPPGLSHLPHVILNQARINELLLHKMYSYNPNQHIDYAHHVNAVQIDLTKDYPVGITASNCGQEKIFRAKYALVGSLVTLTTPDISVDFKDRHVMEPTAASVDLLGIRWLGILRTLSGA
jgi:phenol 2-monooxygenase